MRMRSRTFSALLLALPLVGLTWFLGGCDSRPPITAADAGLAAGDAQLTPAQLTVLVAGDPDADPDARREALISIANSSAAAEPVYLNFYRATLADTGTDPTVAAVAAAALGNHGEPADAGRLTPLLTRDEAFLRWQAAVSLQRLHDPRAIAPLIAAATGDDDPDVRMASATALGQYPRRDVFDALTTVLDDRDYGVSRSARQALALITQHDAGDDPRAWRRYADQNLATLFDQPGEFTYTPFPPSRSLLSSILLFWDQPAAEPQFPTGYTPPGDTNENDQNQDAG